METGASNRLTTTSAVLYIAPVLPALSETFVSGEVLRLRRAGWRVHCASLRAAPPIADPDLEQLRNEATLVYDAGAARLMLDALRFIIARPASGLRTLAQGVSDAISAPGLRWKRRGAVMVQTFAALALSQRVASRSIVHVHAHFAHAPTTVAMYAATALRCAFSFTGHANDLFQRRELLEPKLRRAAFVSCISAWHRDWYATLVSNTKCQMPVIRCGVEIPATIERAQRSPDAPVRILAVGRLVEKKGFDVLMAALAPLHERQTAFELTLIGDGPLRESLEQTADTTLAGRVTFLGARPHREILDQLQQCDIFALPCRADAAGDRDGIPVALMEAMAAGVPVITTGLPAIRELVQHDQTGLLAEPGDTPSLTHSLDRLLQDAHLRVRLGDSGREWVRREFAADINIARLSAAFESVLTHAPVAASQVHA